MVRLALKSVSSLALKSDSGKMTSAAPRRRQSEDAGSELTRTVEQIALTTRVAGETPCSSALPPIEPLNENRSIVILELIFRGVEYAGKKSFLPGDFRV